MKFILDEQEIKEACKEYFLRKVNKKETTGSILEVSLDQEHPDAPIHCELKLKGALIST